MAQRATVPMIIALMAVTLGFATVLLVQENTAPPVTYAGAYVGMMLTVYIGVRLWLPHADALLIPIVTVLSGMGLIMIYRLTYGVKGVENLATTQAVWILVGSGALLLTIVFFRNYRRLIDYKYLLALVGIGLIGSTILFGHEVNGAKLWLQLGPVNLQPAEFARIPLIIFFAGYLADKRELLMIAGRRFLGFWFPSLKYLGPVVLVWALSVVLLAFEKDVGISLLFITVSLLMLYTASGRITYVIFGSALFAAGFFVLYKIFSHVQARMESWLDPWSDPSGKGYQILQSLFSISDGGLTGTGIGNGFAQAIPEVQTDFIFSAIADELGLLGSTALLLVFLIFVYRGMKIALLAEDAASKLLAGGLTTAFALQTLIIVGGVTEAIPLTGLTLPFVSYGGSSVVSNFILTGLLLVISEQAGQRLPAEEGERHSTE